MENRTSGKDHAEPAALPVLPTTSLVAADQVAPNSWIGKLILSAPGLAP